ncbi:hypothetical protein OIU77_023255 [Salix suchowensis]|uniref:Uncharacterized protein n=1 Tax=Salix suchowensis TaxID=1278906 RepID=A0ABQ9C692_9ROSI|nr:hypothetical protein OIU77_023255 [Salix suchowensis]
MSSQTPDMSPSYDNSDDFHDLAFCQKKVLLDTMFSHRSSTVIQRCCRIRVLAKNQACRLHNEPRIMVVSGMDENPGMVRTGCGPQMENTSAEGSKRRHADDDLFGRSFSSRYSLPPSRN